MGLKVLVTGSKGQLGWDVMRELKHRHIDCYGVDIADFDITDTIAVMRNLVNYRPDAVIHCAAYTAVDRAEDDIERCTAINVEGTKNIAEACKETGAKMVYLSTDYVFPGTGDHFHEVDDETDPLGVYGSTKLEGERAVRAQLCRYFIVRVSWVFGKNGNNFVKAMLRLAETSREVSVVDDQVGSPTYTVDLAPLLCDMIVTEKYGTYHATNEGICSFAEFAEEIFRQSGKTVSIRRIPSSEYPSKADRPLNSRLSKKSLDKVGFSRLPTWQDALKRFIHEL